MLSSTRAGGQAASDCARPASTPSTLARNDQSCVRDARAREATCPPSPTRHVRDARARRISLAAPLLPPFVTRGHLPSLAQQSHAVASCLSPENKHGDPNGIRRRASYLPGALSRQPDLALPVP